MRKTVWVAAAASMLANVVHAQSSVVLYGIVDNGIGYQSSATTPGSNSGGHSLVKMTTGVSAADRLGSKGVEDLDGSTKAIFQLEEGFNAVGAELHFEPSVAVDLTAGYAYTRAISANGISSPATYSQLNFTKVYSLSKATSLDAAEGFQRASG